MEVATECHSPLHDALQWHHNELDGVSNHRHLDCLLNRLFRRRSKKASKLRVTGICEGNPPVTGRFPSQKVSNAEMFPFDDVIMGHTRDCKVSEKSNGHVFIPNMRNGWINFLIDGHRLDSLCFVLFELIQGLYSLRRRHLTGIGIPIINLRRSDDRLRFIMGIHILIRRRILSE